MPAQSPQPFAANRARYAVLACDNEPDAEPSTVLGSADGILYPTQAAAEAAVCDDATEILHRISGRRDSEIVTDYDRACTILADAGTLVAVVPVVDVPTVIEQAEPAQAMPLVEGSAADGLYVLEDFPGSRRFRIYDANAYAGSDLIRRAGCHADSTAALAALDAERARRARTAALPIAGRRNQDGTR